MAQLAAQMPVADLASPLKLVAVHQVGAAPGLSSGLQPTAFGAHNLVQARAAPGPCYSRLSAWA